MHVYQSNPGESVFSPDQQAVIRLTFDRIRADPRKVFVDLVYEVEQTYSLTKTARMQVTQAA